MLLCTWLMIVCCCLRALTYPEDWFKFDLLTACLDAEVSRYVSCTPNSPSGCDFSRRSTSTVFLINYTAERSFLMMPWLRPADATLECSRESPVLSCKAFKVIVGMKAALVFERR